MTNKIMESLLCLVLAIGFCQGLVYGAAPTNDQCSGAMVIPSAGPFPYLTPIIPDVSHATTNGDPVPSCDNYVSRGIWFVFTPQAGGTYRFTLNPAETFTTVPNTVMALYRSSGACSGLQEADCSDLNGCAFDAEISSSLLTGRTYYILVWQWGTIEPDEGLPAVQMRVSMPALSPVIPANDLCANAQVIPGAGPFPYLTAPVDTAAATITGETLLSCSNQVFTRGVWYRFQPAEDGLYNISTCYDTATTICDTLMGVYVSTSACAGVVPAPLACANDSCRPDFRAAITTFLSSATNYYVVVWEAEDYPPTPDMTVLQLRVSRLTPRIASFRPTDAGLQLRFMGIVGSNYTVLASANLSNWVQVGSAQGHRKGTNVVTVSGPESGGHQAYRLRLP